MGLCYGTPEQKLQYQQNERIAKEMEKSKEQDIKVIKLLLLGEALCKHDIAIHVGPVCNARAASCLSVR